MKEIKDRKNKVRDHCHVTRLFRGPAHANCNLNYKITNKIPMVFHNLHGYDSHFTMQGIGKFRDVEINVIPSSKDKYMTFTLSKKYLLKLEFIDSFNFMASYLENLVKNLESHKLSTLRMLF